MVQASITYYQIKCTVDQLDELPGLLCERMMTLQDSTTYRGPLAGHQQVRWYAQFSVRDVDWKLVNIGFVFAFPKGNRLRPALSQQPLPFQLCLHALDFLHHITQQFTRMPLTISHTRFNHIHQSIITIRHTHQTSFAPRSIIHQEHLSVKTSRTISSMFLHVSYTLTYTHM